MRSFLAAIERDSPDEFVRVSREVDPKYEITAIVKKFDLEGKYPVLFFENVKGSEMSVVCNVYIPGTRLAKALGTTLPDLEETYNRREEAMLAGMVTYPPVQVTREEAPVKEVVYRGDEIDLTKFPVMTHHVDEPPYITLGIGIVRDPVTGMLHAAHYRLQISGKNEMITHVSPGRHLWHYYKKAEAMGKPLPIAFCLGNHPAWAIGAQSRIAHPPSELDVIGALMEEPLRMVKCETSDVWVPADAEMVFEGELRPGELVDEGPWADMTRYSQKGRRHPLHLSCLTTRKNPIFQDFGTWLGSPQLMTRIPQQVYVRRSVKQAVPSVTDVQVVFYPPQTFCFIKMNKQHQGEPKLAIIAAFASEMYLKYVVVFDHDIDLSKPADIGWALATRVQADKDFLILPGVLGTDLDLSAPEESVVTKVGIDATAKPLFQNYPDIGRISKDLLDSIDTEQIIRESKRVGTGSR